MTGLDEVREHGWASAAEEFFEGEASCAAPIFDRRGVALGAIAISGRIERIYQGSQPLGELIALVRSGARRISNDLGALPW
jgi:DNA-binding IclR family transcriptional regulator